MKKLIIILIPVMLIFCTVFVTVFAEESSGNSCGDNLTWCFNESTGELTISGTGDMDDYCRDYPFNENDPTTAPYTTEYYETSEIRPWVEYENEIKTVVIEDGVTSIGAFAFYGCDNLTKVIIAETVTYIGGAAFEYCWNIVELEMPISAEICDGLTFNGCKNIQFVTLTKGNGETVYNSKGLTPWYISQCSNIVIEEGVTQIGSGMFSDCVKLSSVKLPDTLLNIQSFAFSNCDSLTNIVIPKEVTEIGSYAFSGCSALTNVSLSNKLTLIDTNTFYNCTALTSIILPNSIEFVGSGAFKNCTNLVNINIGDNVSDISQDAFYNTGYYNDIKNWENDVLYISNYVIKAKNSIIGEYQVKPGTKTICEDAFGNCTELTSIIIPDSVNCIGRSAFWGCVGITEITMPISATFQIVDEGAAFGCPNIKKVTLTNGNGKSIEYDSWVYYESKPWTACSEVVISEGVTRIGANTFAHCDNLTNLTIPDSVDTIGENAFSNCDNLTEVMVGNGTTTIEQGAFAGCDSLVNVNLGNRVSRIGSNAFEICNSLKTIAIPESVEKIDKNAFACCPNLEYIRFEGSGSIDISNEAFFDSPKAMICCYENSYLHSYADANDMKVCLYDKNGIPSFEIKNDVLVSYRGNAADVFVSSGTKVGYGAFENNENIEKVELSSAITRIYDNAFKCCSSLKTIIIPQAVSSIGDNAFEGCDDLTIYGYAGSYAESYAKKHSIKFEYITLTISADEYEANVFDTFMLEPSFNILRNEADEIVWSCDDNGVVSVSSNGEVTALKEGTANVTATSESGLYATCLVKVQNFEPEVNGKVNSVSVSDVALYYKASTTITPSISVDSGVKYTVTYSSSDPSVASIDANGKVVAGKTGSATITVTVTDEFGNTVSDTCEVKVNYNWWQWILVIVLFGWIWY